MKGIIIFTWFPIDINQDKDQFTIRYTQPTGRQPQVALSRVMPYFRRKRTFIIPIERSSIIVPQSYGLHPEQWYDKEQSWLDWALNQLGKPSLNEIVQQLNNIL